MYYSPNDEPCDAINVINHKYLKKSIYLDPNNDEYIFEFSFHLSDEVKDQFKQLMRENIYSIKIIDVSKIDDKYMEKFLIFLINSKINLKNIKWINFGKRKFYEREYNLLLKLILSQFSELKEHNMLNPFKN